jgi:hypothetical protein
MSHQRIERQERETVEYREYWHNIIECECGEFGTRYWNSGLDRYKLIQAHTEHALRANLAVYGEAGTCAVCHEYVWDDYLCSSCREIGLHERQVEILQRRIKTLEAQLKAGRFDEGELEARVMAGLRLYFEHHPQANKENIGSIWIRIKDKLANE